MAPNIESMNRETIEPIRLTVLGGTFTVREIVLDKHDSKEEVLSLIHSTPGDRWFVILAEGEIGSQDVLALIDDSFEFHFVGLGILEND